MKIYIVSYEEFNQKCNPDDNTIDALENATEEEIIALNKESKYRICTPEPYTLDEFMNQFNYSTIYPIDSENFYLKLIKDNESK